MRDPAVLAQLCWAFLETASRRAEEAVRSPQSSVCVCALHNTGHYFKPRFQSSVPGGEGFYLNESPDFSEKRCPWSQIAGIGGPFLIRKAERLPASCSCETALVPFSL